MYVIASMNGCANAHDMSVTAHLINTMSCHTMPCLIIFTAMPCLIIFNGMPCTGDVDAIVIPMVSRYHNMLAYGAELVSGVRNDKCSYDPVTDQVVFAQVSD